MYIKRDYLDQKRNYPSSYYKVEIESYDPNNIYSKVAPLGFSKDSNTTGAFVLGCNTLTGKNKSKSFNLSSDFNILESGSYRVEVFYISSRYAQTVMLQLGSTKRTFSAQAKDNFFRKYDAGSITVLKGKLATKITSGGDVKIIGVYLRKVRKNSGDSANEGLIHIETADIKLTDATEMATMNLNMQHIDKPYNEGGFLEEGNKSGLVFEYRDPINLIVRDIYGKLVNVFGGYISQPILSDDNMNIRLECVDRMKDAEKQNCLKEISVGGEISDNWELFYDADNFYDTLSYLAQSIELPLSVSNVTTLKNEIPLKDSIFTSFDTYNTIKNVVVNNIVKTPIKSGKKYDKISLRNTPKKGKVQAAVLYDSNNARDKKGLLINDKPIFFINYGMGSKPITKTWVEKKYNKKTKKTKKITHKLTKGYDISSPFLAYIELKYSLKFNSGVKDIKTVNIDFTSTTTTNKIGTIKTILKQNVMKRGEIDVMHVLKAKEGVGANIYIRKISLKFTVSNTGDLYDPSTDVSKYNMLFKSVGFRKGFNARVPSLMQSSGKKLLELIKEACNVLELSPRLKYSSDRSKDTLILDKMEENIALLELKEGLDGNISALGNITYTPLTKLKNNITKVYKQSTGNYKYVMVKDLANIMRYGVHDDVEVINEEIGTYYADYLARTDLDKNTEMDFSRPLTIEGYPSLEKGQLVFGSFTNSLYDDVKPIESIEVKIDVSDAPNIHTTYGWGELSPSVASAKNISNIRKVWDTKRRLFGGGATEVDYFEL